MSIVVQKYDGSSDTTAVAMAATLGADWCEICSDVDRIASE